MLDTAVQYNLCKTATLKKTKHWFSLMQDKSIAECSKVEHSAILSNFIKLPFLIRIFILSFLSGRFTKVLLYRGSLLGKSTLLTTASLWLPVELLYREEIIIYYIFLVTFLIYNNNDVDVFSRAKYEGVIQIWINTKLVCG